MLGLVCGDSLGAPMEFSHVRYGHTDYKDMGQEDVWKSGRRNRFMLKPGQWTDDSSMALCLADSLLVNKTLNPRDLRLRFLNWWQLGYNNAFGFDEDRNRTGSVGLGGNISQSFSEFVEEMTEFTTAGDRATSGNGSIMRLAPVPLFYWRDEASAEAAAYWQSKTTHQGDEAAECARLLAHVVVRAINAPETEPAAIKDSVLGRLEETFGTELYSVQCLAASRQEERHKSNKGADLEDRNWNWREPGYKYSPTRAAEQPGYIGSYAMDALAMALHCVWSTTSLRDALLKGANMCGDSDTVCAVIGQIAGAIYGASSIPPTWISCVQMWDGGGSIALRAYKLLVAQPEAYAPPSSDAVAAEAAKVKAAAKAAKVKAAARSRDEEEEGEGEEGEDVGTQEEATESGEGENSSAAASK